MNRDWLMSGALLLLLCALFLISLLAGRVWLPAGDVWHGLWSPDENLAATIVTQLRLPRAILALEVGAAGVPSASEVLPPNSAVSSLRIVFCSRRKVAVELMSSNPCAAASASNVTVSSSPSVT